MNKLILLPWTFILAPDGSELYVLPDVKNRQVAFIVRWAPEQFYHWCISPLSNWERVRDLEGTGETVEFCKERVWAQLQQYDAIIVQPKYSALA